ncbi:MAG: glycosyltransferase [Bacteroidetes bacterium]|nr:glycosyltransferase [Bacteroidota bacterium]
MNNQKQNTRLKKVLFGVLNWGLGHATRSTPLIQHLTNSGVEVEIASDGLALAYLQQEFPALKFHKLKGYDIQYSTNKNLLLLALLCQIPKLKIAIASEQKKVKEILSKDSFDLILSDNRYGFRSLEVKSFLISHQLKLITPPIFKGVNNVLLKYQKGFKSIFIPDYANQEKKLSGKLSETNLPHHFIHPISAFSEPVAITSVKDIDYLIILSGPEPQRTLLERRLIEIIPLKEIKVVLIRGTEQPFSEKSNIETHNLVQRNELEKLIYRSKKLICRSGYSTIMDMHFLQIPCILIPTPGQTEQEYLAELLLDDPSFLVTQQHLLTSKIFDWEPKKTMQKKPFLAQKLVNRKAFEDALLLEGFVMPTS